jgi:hypothetical protein
MWDLTRRSINNPPAAKSTKPLGSGTAVTGLPMLVCDEKLVTVAVPSRLTSIVVANPSVRSDVSAGTVPAASENMLNANVLPEVDIPSGEFTAGP